MTQKSQGLVWGFSIHQPGLPSVGPEDRGEKGTAREGVIWAQLVQE